MEVNKSDMFKKLKAVIKYWLPWYEKEYGKLSKKHVELLRTISPATIDQLLKKFRSRYNKRGLCTTKPGGILRELVPIKTDQWNERRPGYSHWMDITASSMGEKEKKEYLKQYGI